MKKLTVRILIALIIAAMFLPALGGCKLFGKNDERYLAQIIARVGDTTITLGDFEAAYLNELDMQGVGYYGFDPDSPPSEYVSMIEGIKDNVFNNLIRKRVLELKAKEMEVYDRTKEDEAAGQEEYDKALDGLMENMVQKREDNNSQIKFAKEQEIKDDWKAKAEALGEDDEPIDVDASAKEEYEKWLAETDELMTEDEIKADAKEEYDQILADYDENYGLEKFLEDLTQSAQERRAFEAVDASVTDDITISADEIKAEFDKLVADQKEEYKTALPSFGLRWQFDQAKAVNKPVIEAKKQELKAEMADATEDQIDKALEDWKMETEDLLQEDPSFVLAFTPTGYRSVKHILVPLSDDAKALITEKRSEAAMAEDDDENEALLKEADAIRDEQLLAIIENAEGIVARAKAGEDFDALIDEIGRDYYLEREPNKTLGLPLCSESTGMPEDYMKAALALEKVGDTSQPLATDEGYYIIQYTTEINPGTSNLDDVSENIHDILLAEAKAARMEKMFEEWEADYKVKKFPRLLEKFKLNRGQYDAVG